MSDIVQQDNRIVGLDGAPIGRAFRDDASIEREFYFLNEEGKECYLCLVRRHKDDEIFQAGLILDQEDPIVTWVIWWNIECALEAHHNLRVVI